MKIHILGICGTFMAGVAVLAKQLGYEVSGSDQDFYPPMSTQLEAEGIRLYQGFDPALMKEGFNCVVIGNAMPRGNPCVETILENNIPYVSGPQWLAEHLLAKHWVLAVSGTHGKTTTTSMLTWILQYAGLEPGFLIGGVPENFGISAKLGKGAHFVIEADEYDSAFFDKRSKFIHYHPRTLIMNNLEFDHADIFSDLEAIKRQFQHLVKTVPGNGLLIYPEKDLALQDVLARGCWTKAETIGDGCAWEAKNIYADASVFDVYYQGQKAAVVKWSLLGLHNVHNALAAIAAAHHAGVSIETTAAALSEFKNVKRRMEIKAELPGIILYDDFAHHPTAIAAVLDGLRAKISAADRIVAVLEFGSYTMRSGCHADELLSNALQRADEVVLLRPRESGWDVDEFSRCFACPIHIYHDVAAIVADLSAKARIWRGTKNTTHIVTMSSRGFDGIHKKLLDQIYSEQTNPTFV